MNFSSYLLWLLANILLSQSTKSLNILLNDEWLMFVNKYNKSYEDVYHELDRRRIWEDNIQFIQKHNIKFDLGHHKYSLGINQFADLTHEEFKLLYLPVTFPHKKHSKTFSTFNTSFNLPKSVDWRKKGYVTDVKDQGQCGSCWAFSTTGSVEGQYFKKTKTLISLSEQQLVDCAKENSGCQGGYMTVAFQYIRMAGGIQSEKDYPYQAKVGPCTFDISEAITTCTSFKDVEKTEEDLAHSVAEVGPISIAIDASHRTFQFYKNGIYNEPSCSNINLDHAVLLIGYGITTSNEKYWIVKNSWSKSWGKEGYIWMTKDEDNQCGVASMASYPIV